MNNDLKQFSEESLKKMIFLEGSGCVVYQANEVAALARIALAAKQAKPVAWRVGGYLSNDKKWAEKASAEENYLLEPLYEHPLITGIDENHYDPELEPGLYVAEIMTKGGAACINGRFTKQVNSLDETPAEYQIREINASGTKWSPWRKVSADYYEKMKARYEVMNPGVECIQHRELYTTPQPDHTEQDGWIKCSERMPDHKVNVLAATACGSIWTAFYNENRNCWDDGDYYDDINNVTHWMPLPAAPKPESE